MLGRRLPIFLRTDVDAGSRSFFFAALLALFIFNPNKNMNSKIEQEISKYLTEKRKRGGPVARPLVVTICNGNYGCPSSVILEVEGSPTKGMAIVRLGECSHLHNKHLIDSGFYTVWILDDDDKMRKLPYRGATSKKIVKYVQEIYSANVSGELRIPSEPKKDQP
jgi:hypothetical protein